MNYFGSTLSQILKILLNFIVNTFFNVKHYLLQNKIMNDCKIKL